MEGEVVVLLDITLYEERDLHVARFRELGLTAYGQTKDEAVTALKKMFNVFIRTYRDSGQLEMRLDEVRTRWWYRGEYPADKGYPPVEDTNLLVGQQPSDQPVVRVARELTDQPVPQFAIAA